MYCWEGYFLEKIMVSRKKELKYYRSRDIWGYFSHRFLTSFGRIMTVLTITIFFSYQKVESFRSGDIFVVSGFIDNINSAIGTVIEIFIRNFCPRMVYYKLL